MKYAVIQCVNGSNKVIAEGITDVNRAKVTYHGTCQSLWNAPDVVTASVMIVDENLNVEGRYKESISKAAAPAETPEE